MSMEPPQITPELLEQNPELALALSFFSLFILGGFAASIGAWGWVLWRWYHRRQVLPFHQWEPSKWGLVELVLAFVVFYSSQIVLASLAGGWLGIDWKNAAKAEELPMAFNAIVSCGNLLTVGIMTGWIIFRFGVSPHHVGWTHSIGREIMIGLVAGLVVIPVVYLLSAIVSIQFETEYSHPILEALEKESSLASFLMAAFVAVIAAPVFEEFAFRVLLQGWLQSLSKRSVFAAVFGEFVPNNYVASDSGTGDGEAENAVEPAGSQTPSSAVPAVPEAGSTSELPSITASAAQQPLSAFVSDSDSPRLDATLADSGPVYQAQIVTNEKEANPDAGATWGRPPVWASVVSGTLFGLAHWGYGLSFIPLIVFGIALGVVYRARSSIWPCIVMHMMLNATSILAMGINVMLRQAVVQ